MNHWTFFFDWKLGRFVLPLLFYLLLFPGSYLVLAMVWLVCSSVALCFALFLIFSPYLWSHPGLVLFTSLQSGDSCLHLWWGLLCYFLSYLRERSATCLFVYIVKVVILHFALLRNAQESKIMMLLTIEQLSTCLKLQTCGLMTS